MSGRGRVRVSLGDDGLGGVVQQRVNQQVRVAGTVVTDLAMMAKFSWSNAIPSFWQPG
jgi:hypothetical protein